MCSLVEQFSLLAKNHIDAALLPCPDQYVGDITKNEEYVYGFIDKEFSRKHVFNAPKEQPRLIIILESPHKDEYHQSSKIPIGPANGITGDNIRKHINSALNLGPNGSILYDDRYSLILINPIQFQCSMGKSKPVLRDNTFIELWNNGGENDFCQRLHSYCRESDVVVNCCTKGERNLRTLVRDAIDQTCRLPTSVRLVHRCHPSSGHWQTGFEWA